MAHSSFARSLAEVSSTDGSLCRTILDSVRGSGSNNSSSVAVTTSVLLSKVRPNNNSTPSRDVPSLSRQTPGQHSKTPKSSNSKSFIACDGDRFIPNRHSTDLDRAQHVIKANIDENQCTEDSDYRRAVSESLFGGDSDKTRILRFRSTVKSGVSRDAPSTIVSAQKAINNRMIPTSPEKVLDAPEIMDDFYLNILDWSSENMLAVALNQEVYVWNAVSGQIACLMSTGLEGEYVSSLSWSPEATNVIAVGTSAGRVQLWDAGTQSLLRTMRLGQESAATRVPVVKWREHIVTSGSRSGHIRQHDIRVAQHEVGMSEFHSQEVCGLAWSPDNSHLASGANDNCVAIWPASIVSQSGSSVRPALTLTDHQAAVKAMSWCPWKDNLLCTGGGTEDHTLRFWNTSTGRCAKSVDVTAQVSGILWNTEYREILTSHGVPKNRLIIWRYPSIDCVTELAEQQGRVLCVAASPNNEMVASCASDETLRIWNCFEVDHRKKRIEEKANRASALTRNMR